MVHEGSDGGVEPCPECVQAQAPEWDLR